MKSFGICIVQYITVHGFAAKCRLFLVDPGEIFTWNPRTLKIHRYTNSNKFWEFVTRSSRRSISKTDGVSWCIRIYGRFTVIFLTREFVYILKYVGSSIYRPFFLRKNRDLGIKAFFSPSVATFTCRYQYTGLNPKIEIPENFGVVWGC